MQTYSRNRTVLNKQHNNFTIIHLSRSCVDENLLFSVLHIVNLVVDVFCNRRILRHQLLERLGASLQKTELGLQEAQRQGIQAGASSPKEDNESFCRSRLKSEKSQ